MVMKENGESRFCCNVRPLNEVTIEKAYPLPGTDSCMDILENFSPESRSQQDSFCLDLGLFEWCCMLFVLCNASPGFQRAVAGEVQRIVNR